MAEQLSLRRARPQDFAFCELLYFEGMGWIIQALNLDMARQRESFTSQWQPAEVRVITAANEDIGWLQTTPADDAVFLAQFYLDGRFRR
jgi:hypothetical protein